MLVESLAYNLLSIHQLALMGFAIFLDIDTLALLWSKTFKVAFVGHVKNGLYVIKFSERPTKIATCLMAKVDMGWLWHRRLTHVNMISLQSLLKGHHVNGLTNVGFSKDHACSACIERKLHEKAHPPTTIIYSKRPLELLHMDLFGPPGGRGGERHRGRRCRALGVT